MYHEINETLARSAKQANSMSDYVEGSATQEYKKACDEITALGERCKAGSYEPDAIRVAKEILKSTEATT